MNALLTGSQVYGAPTNASDVDLVVMCDEETAKKIATLPGAWCKQKAETNYRCGGIHSSVRFGNLNLLIVTNDGDMNAWVQGTRVLRELADARGRRVTREEASEVFAALRQQNVPKK